MPFINGIIEWTGGHGTGKTLAALQAGCKNIMIFDDDVKGRETVETIIEASKDKISINYIDALAMSQKAKRPHVYYAQIKSMIENIQPDQYDHVIFDTWTRIAKACREEVIENTAVYKDKDRNGKFFTGDSAMINGQISRIARDLEAGLINILASKVPLISLIDHLKKDYQNNVDTGKRVPDATATLDKIPQMRVWLKLNPNSAVPISLFIKRPHVSAWSDEKGRIDTVNVFPQKITPDEHDTSVWDGYLRYIQNPMGVRAPTDSETPNVHELSIIENTLTAEQRQIYQQALRIASLQSEPLEIDVDEPQTTEQAVKELLAKKIPVPAIAKRLKITIDEVKEHL